MAGRLGITNQGLETALKIKESYKKRMPLCIPGEESRILVPENLMNASLNLNGLEDPIALAVMATRDPESPMALAASARLSPLGSTNKLIEGVVHIVGQTSKHPLVKKCIHLVQESAFNPSAISAVQRSAAQFILKTRKQYTNALRQNLYGLMNGNVAPREFVQEFFQLTEAGNMRHDIRKKLLLSLMLSRTVRPSIKFMMLENLHRMPAPVRRSIIEGVLKTEPLDHHVAVIQEELKWMAKQEQLYRTAH
ncbi:MAG: hypothetical protein ACO3MW_12760 [Rhodospirillales bacterium]|jgi:hypothetical protein